MGKKGKTPQQCWYREGEWTVDGGRRMMHDGGEATVRGTTRPPMQSVAKFPIHLILPCLPKNTTTPHHTYRESGNVARACRILASKSWPLILLLLHASADHWPVRATCMLLSARTYGGLTTCFVILYTSFFFLYVQRSLGQRYGVQCTHALFLGGFERGQLGLEKLLVKPFHLFSYSLYYMHMSLHDSCLPFFFKKIWGTLPPKKLFI
jgi:hypothetical protein